MVIQSPASFPIQVENPFFQTKQNGAIVVSEKPFIRWGMNKQRGETAKELERQTAEV